MPNNGDGSSGGKGEPGRSDKESPRSGQSHARALVISAAAVVICFLAHILILFLVQPLQVLHLSRLNAYAMSTIPLGMGLVFLFDAINSFRHIESRSLAHFVPFLLAIVFGSLSVQGFLGFILYLVRHPPAL